MACKRMLKIINAKGLHARAAAKFVETVERFDCSVDVRKDGLSAVGDSIMGLLLLGASRGTSIEITVSGDDEVALTEALADLIASGFGESV